MKTSTLLTHCAFVLSVLKCIWLFVSTSIFVCLSDCVNVGLLVCLGGRVCVSRYFSFCMCVGCGPDSLCVYFCVSFWLCVCVCGGCRLVLISYCAQKLYPPIWLHFTWFYPQVLSTSFFLLKCVHHIFLSVPRTLANVWNSLKILPWKHFESYNFQNYFKKFRRKIICKLFKKYWLIFIFLPNCWIWFLSFIYLWTIPLTL